MLTFNQLKKNLKKDFSRFRTVKVAILSDNASQLLHQALKAYGYEAKVNFEIYEADYNQIDLQIFDNSSGLYTFQPDFIFINKSSEHFLKDFYGINPDRQDEYAECTRQKVENYFNCIAS